MQLHERIACLAALGEQLQQTDEFLDALIHRTSFHNPWFTKENQKRAVRAIAENFLDKNKLEAWLRAYQIPEIQAPSTVGIIMAGNIPLVGFHDLLCVFASGHPCQIKLSEKDPYLLPYLLQLLGRLDGRTALYFKIQEKLEGFDKVIATGSNNSARYFEYYFGKYPHIIRKNRNSVAVLSGQETDAQLLALGNDIFSYFGLGCRNVSKLYIPAGYDRKHLLEILHEYKDLVLHTKYKNNFDYNFAMLSLNRIPFDINGCIILQEETSLHSRIAMLHYEYYDTPENLSEELERRRGEIQCIVSSPGILRSHTTIPFGQSQQPQLWDYADNVDVMAFLLT